MSRLSLLIQMYQPIHFNAFQFLQTHWEAGWFDLLIRGSHQG